MTAALRPMRAPAASAAVAAWLVGASAVLAQPATDYDDRIIDACLSEHWGGLNARESCIGIAARACMPVGEGDAAVAVACFDAERAQWDARMTDALDALRGLLAEQGGAGGAVSADASGEVAEGGGRDSAAAENAAADTAAADAAAMGIAPADSAADVDAATPAPAAAADNTADAAAPATDPADTGTTENPALTALNTMQSAWETWRDAACAYDAALYPGTSVAETVRADCLMRLTARQAFHLTARLERGD